MKILTFNYEYPPLGGGGGVIHALVAEWLAQRHRVWVVTSAGDGLPRRETRNGVEVLRVRVIGRTDQSAASLASMLSYPPMALIAAARLLQREKFDVIHSHFAVPTGPGSLPSAMLAGLPHVLSLHGGDIYDPSKRLSPHRVPFVRHTVEWVLRRSDVVVAQSRNTRSNVYRYYRYRGPIEIIPLGIRQPAVDPATREQLGLPCHTFLAVTVGRLVRRKRLEHLFRAMAQPECAGVHLVAVGSGPELERLREATASMGIGDRVVFTGQVSEERKWQILHSANAYVSATMHEGFGLVYLEAMAAGLPVITYDEGGQVDFLQDGETGYLIPEGDLEALAAAIARAMSEPEQMARMGSVNRKRAQRYRIEHCAQSYEALLEHVINEAPRRRGRTLI